MKNLEEQILELKIHLQNTINVLTVTDLDNFDSQIKMVQDIINQINALRKKLKNEYEINILRKYDTELLFLTKQIKTSFDNIGRKLKNEADKVSKELRNLQNSKKLTSYKR